MATQRNWNPQIGPAVAHITDTQWNVPLPMRELDPSLIRANPAAMPRGQGITGKLGRGVNPMEGLFGASGAKDRDGKQRAPGDQTTVVNTGHIGDEQQAVNNYTYTPYAEGAGNVPPYRRHNLRNVRGVTDTTGRELPGLRALGTGQPVRQLGMPRNRIPALGTGRPVIGITPSF